jgi:glutathione peroxidase
MWLLKYLTILILFIDVVFANMKTAYDFNFNSIDGGKINLSQYTGKVLIITNVASKCGFTNQYEGLQKTWEEYKGKGVVVIGVSSDDFNQELNSREEVKKFCEVNFGINFPMTDITKVKGNEAHPFYKWVLDSHGSKPKWNFYKILINKNGHVQETFSSFTKPDSEKFKKAIENIL